MPSTPLNPPDHPIALRHSHLLAPAPDRLTNTPTTLTVTRENTHSGRDFSIHQLRKDEPLDSFRRTSLLYTVSGRFWSNSQLREIRDSSGRPLLELRRIWWRGQWIVKRAGGVGDELLSAEMRWGIGMKIGARFCNALIAGREGITLSRRGLSPSPNPINRYPFNQNAGERPRPRTAVSSSNIIPASGPGSTSASAAAAATASASASTSTGRGIRPGTAYTRPTPTRRRTISNYPHAPPIARDAPPPYTATVAADTQHIHPVMIAQVIHTVQHQAVLHYPVPTTAPPPITTAAAVKATVTAKVIPKVEVQSSPHTKVSEECVDKVPVTVYENY